MNFLSMAASNSHDLSKSHDALEACSWAREERLILVFGNAVNILEIMASERHFEKI